MNRSCAGRKVESVVQEKPPGHHAGRLNCLSPSHVWEKTPNSVNRFSVNPPGQDHRGNGGGIRFPRRERSKSFHRLTSGGRAFISISASVFGVGRTIDNLCLRISAKMTGDSGDRDRHSGNLTANSGLTPGIGHVQSERAVTLVRNTQCSKPNSQRQRQIQKPNRSRHNNNPTTLEPLKLYILGLWFDTSVWHVMTSFAGICVGVTYR
jgi:hypothetical protein